MDKAAKLIFLSAIFVARACGEYDRTLQRLPRQALSKNGQQDQSSAETGFLGGGGVENSKYFHYQHLPEHDKYEFGHRRGNDHHVIERYEKAIPHEGQFKTKVRWADKKGGHGEHYWDYNHAGHGGNGGHGGHGGQNEGDRNGGYSDPVPAYSPLVKSSKTHQKRQLEAEKKLSLEDVESSDPDMGNTERTSPENNTEKEIGSLEKYDIQKATGKQKKDSLQGETTVVDSHLFFDLKTGKVVDELTGKKYILQPVN